MLRYAFLSAIFFSSGVTYAAAQSAADDAEAPPTVQEPDAQRLPAENQDRAPKTPRGDRRTHEKAPAASDDEATANQGSDERPARRDREARDPSDLANERAAPKEARKEGSAKSEPKDAPSERDSSERPSAAAPVAEEPNRPKADQAQPTKERSTEPEQPRNAEALPKDTPAIREKSEGASKESAERPRRDNAAGAPQRPANPPPPAAAAPAPETAGKKQMLMPTDERKAKEVIRKERANADAEFERAKKSAGGKDSPRVDPKAASRFERVRGERKERVEKGGVAVIEEPDKRLIVRSKDRAFIQHDESTRLGRSARESKRERRNDGTTVVVNIGAGGIEITSIFNDRGQLLRRSRKDKGREIVLIDNRDYYSRPRDRYADPYIDLPPPAVRIPRDRYIVEYDRASERDVYDALMAPPVERLQRGYSLEEIRRSYPLRQRMARVDLDTINFAFASWDVDPQQYPKLERIADAMKRIINRNPDEIFMIEGHTDAVGSDIDNLSLSDRRAETVAIILSDTFRVPPENLVTQGYGEEFLKVNTQAPSQANRRVAVRRITPLLSRR